MQSLTSQKNLNLYIKIFFFYILINPLLDLLSGVFMDVLQIQSSITPSLVLRMGFLLGMVLFLIINRDLKTIKYLAILFSLWVLNLIGQYLFSSTHNYFVEAQYFARFIYNLIIIFAYEIIFEMCEKSKVDWKRALINCLSFVSLSASLIIVISFILKFGLSSYSNLTGNKGYFHAANDITAVLLTIFPITICAFFSRSNTLGKYEKILKIISPILTADALLLIGTRTAYIAIIFNIIAILAFVLIKGSKPQKRTILFLIGLIAASYVVLFCLPSSKGFLEDSLRIQKYNMEDKHKDDPTGFLLSNRNVKAKETFENYKKANIYTKIFGLGRGTQINTIEMDILEIFMYYGIIGLVLLTFAYLKRGTGFLIYAFKNMTLENFCILMSLLLTAAYAFLAGHVLFSGTSGIYFSLVIAYAYKKIKYPGNAYTYIS